MLEDKFFMKGHLVIKTRKKGEDWKIRVDKDNLIVDMGLNLARDNVFGVQSYYVQWGAVSDDTTAPVAGNTSLGGNEFRDTFTASSVATSKQFFCEFYIAATEWAGASLTSVSKAGLYYQSTGNYLFNAASFDPISVDTTIEMIVQWTISNSG